MGTTFSTDEDAAAPERSRSMSLARSMSLTRSRSMSQNRPGQSQGNSVASRQSRRNVYPSHPIDKLHAQIVAGPETLGDSELAAWICHANRWYFLRAILGEKLILDID